MDKPSRFQNMTNPVLIGLISAGVLLGAVGLVRAVAQYGSAGFVAFLEVLLLCCWRVLSA